eukprot:CAMPEP_0171416862 /NCGR_PEP_ID=MMETSP0880-20121228/40312_1 /TAXON_ID=67004 /ORGANISM="Thalassiosira weissflogii, Strain CCMP1336" /LENGTH=474 /DNA_ID=CAMNT_0011935117 /DNA_START=160 /DNA_END=1584 /DNA_ORIENTATION=+
MPTFPNHWAGISGSIEEEDASPLDAALRELREETNVGELFEEYFLREKEHASGAVSGDGNGRCVGDNVNGMIRSHIKAGLHVDVISKGSRGAFGGRTIRVYPFALTLPDAEMRHHVSQNLWSEIVMRGTEHDEMKFLTLDEFFDLNPCVPDLKLAFHHATSGAYLDLPDEVRKWEKDRINGAASLARMAISLAAKYSDENCSLGGYIIATNDINHKKCSMALSIAMLRPSMVPIVNIMKEFEKRMQLETKKQDIEKDLLNSLSSDGLKCVELGVDAVMTRYNEWESMKQRQTENTYTSKDFVVGTFSRSSTLKFIIEQLTKKLEEIRKNSTDPLSEQFTKKLLEIKKYSTDPSKTASKIQIICSQSTPGDEGKLMAADIPDASWLSDDDFAHELRNGHINIVIVGADCILHEGRGVVNKVGTAGLASMCKKSDVPIICCADMWKLWDDIHPPPLEDIFELIPMDLFDRVLVPTD